MTGFILALALLGGFSVPCNGLPGVAEPTLTKIRPHKPAWSPEPTQAANIERKRDLGGTCGFVDGMSGSSFYQFIRH